MVTSLGNEDGSIFRTKISLPSYILSLFIGTLNKVMVVPALNVRLYGPEV